MDKASLFFGDGEGGSVEVTRLSPDAAWAGPAACPVCGQDPIRVRAYEDDPKGPHRDGFVTALAWCSGRHAEPVGYLQEPAVPGVLRFMGRIEEMFRCRIY